MTRRLPAAQRRQQLLDTAATMFAKRGYSGTTTSELAREAGVTEPIIYRHFKSKRELFVALIDETGEQTIERWESALARCDDPGDKLRLLIGANPMVESRGDRVYRVIVQAMTEIDDEEILDAITRHMKALHGFLAGRSPRLRRPATSPNASAPASPPGCSCTSASASACSPPSASRATAATSPARASATSSSSSCSASSDRGPSTAGPAPGSTAAPASARSTA